MGIFWRWAQGLGIHVATALVTLITVSIKGLHLTSLFIFGNVDLILSDAAQTCASSLQDDQTWDFSVILIPTPYTHLLVCSNCLLSLEIEGKKDLERVTWLQTKSQRVA